MKKILKKYMLITAACIIYAFGYACFLSPNLLAPGGVSGIAVILGKFIPVDDGIIILCINIPLLITGAVIFGRQFFFSTIYATVASSLFISAMSYLPDYFFPLTDDLLLAGLAGGVLTAVGIGMTFREGATTGGTDIIVRLIQLKMPHIKTGGIFMTVDSAIVLLSAVIFGNINIALYAAVALFVNTKVVDSILYGANTARMLLIITRKPNELTEQITLSLDAGITVIEARGGYTGAENTMLVCAVKKRAFPKLKELVLSIDPMSFIIVSSADEIYGEGFIRSPKLNP